MLGRLPLIVGIVAALAALLLVGPVAVAVALMRSSPDVQGSALPAQIFIALLTVAVILLAGAAAWGPTRLAFRLFRRGG